MTFSEPKKKGDLLKSEDWNALTAEVKRLETEKLNRNQNDTFKGSLTVEGALNIKPKEEAKKAELNITGSLSVSQSLAVGDFLSIDSEKKSLTLGGVEISGFNNEGSLKEDNKSVPTQSVIKRYVDNIAQLKAEKEGSDSQDFLAKELTVKDKITISKSKEIFFEDNGQIRSHDDTHRIIFDRENNKLKLIEYGEIQLFPGYNNGDTGNSPKLVVTREGNVKIDGELNVSKSISFSEQPMLLRSYRLDDNPNHDTGYDSGNWLGIIAGFDFNVANGNSIQGVRISIQDKGGKLHILGDVIGVHEKWNFVHVLFIKKNWVKEANTYL